MRRGLLGVTTALALTGAIGAAGPAFAQQSWVQIEAQPSLSQAEERARDYAGGLSNIAGFSMNTGWYAVAIGPFPDPEAARAQLRNLRRGGLIPSDSYVSDGARFGQRFWPAGSAPLPVVASQPLPGTAPGEQPPSGAAIGDLPAADVAALPLESGTGLTAPPTAAPEPAAPVPAAPLSVAIAPQETLAEARAAEAALPLEDRRDLQSALKWEGFYASTIDGLIGRGTRSSMADWQAAQGYEATGVLTTAQRTQLVAGWRADLAALGLASLTDDEAGIELTLPLALVEFSRYEPPFAHYDAKNGSGVQVILISQPGDGATLAALYDLLQTLAIVPPEGPRQLGAGSFTIDGAGPDLRGHVEATLKDGVIKGFILGWPAAKTREIAPALEAMQASFRPLDGQVLDAAAGVPSATPGTTLVAGLQQRQPKLARTGFFIDRRGTVVTVAEAVENCGSVTLDGGIDATVAAVDPQAGIAILAPRAPLAPPAVASLDTGPAATGSELAVAGFAYAEELDAPVMTFGQLAADTGLAGETGVYRLALTALPGDAGGPVVDASGTVTAMMLPRPRQDGRVLPEDVSYALKAGVLAPALAALGYPVETRAPGAALANQDLTDRALKMTVRVSCWE